MKELRHKNQVKLCFFYTLGNVVVCCSFVVIRRCLFGAPGKILNYGKSTNFLLSWFLRVHQRKLDLLEYFCLYLTPTVFPLNIGTS